jgi:hypothetical protein
MKKLEDSRVQLDDGVLITSTRPKIDHQIITALRDEANLLEVDAQYEEWRKLHIVKNRLYY